MERKGSHGTDWNLNLPDQYLEYLQQTFETIFIPNFADWSHKIQLQQASRQRTLPFFSFFFSKSTLTKKIAE